MLSPQKIITICWWVSLVALTFSCRPENEKKQAAEEKAALLSASLDSLLNDHEAMSSVLLVVDSGKIVYEKAQGYRNFPKQIPLETTDIFELASVSKQFTAMTIVLLADAGKLQYSDSLGQYFPELPYPEVTIRQMLTHTSGLPDYMQLFDEHWDKTQVADNDDIIQYLIQYYPPMLFEPGTKYTYSNTAYCLLASIAEKVSGKDFETFAYKSIFEPLGMKSIAIRSTVQKKNLPNFAQGHIYNSTKNAYLPADSFPGTDYNFYLGGRIGPGRISSNAQDLLRWDQALYDESLVSQETLREQVFKPYELKNGEKGNYGFGWFIEKGPTYGQKVWHDGDNPGYRTAIVRYIDQQKTVILLCNNQYKPFLKVLDDIESVLFPELEFQKNQ